MNKKRQQTIKNLVMSAWNEDVEAFSILYSMTVDNIFNYCRMLLKTDVNARLAVKNIYSQAYDSILNLTDPLLFEAWLKRIAFQVCFDSLLDPQNPFSYSVLPPAELDSLPFSERQILFLCDYRDIPVGEIASLLQISVRHVNKDLLLARKHIIQLKNSTTTI